MFYEDAVVPQGSVLPVFSPPPRTSPAWLTALAQLDKLVISQLGLLAQRRLARGVKLNHTEATVGVRDACPYLLLGNVF